MKCVYILTSLPGAGKSTWANRFIKNNPNSFIISSDELRKSICGDYQDFSKEKYIWKKFFLLANEIANKNKDCNVILDSTCINNKYREEYYLKTSSFDKHILVYFNIDINLCKKRNLIRNKDKVVPDFVIDKMNLELEKPSEDILNLYDEFIEIID